MALDSGKYDCLFVDCDGVIWCGKDPISGSIPALLSLQSLKKRLLFFANDFIYSQDQPANSLSLTSPVLRVKSSIQEPVYMRASFC